MKTEYELSKHRFYELKHFCLQVPEWQALYSKLDGWTEESGSNGGDTTSRDGIRRADLSTLIGIVQDTAKAVGGEYERDILRCVTLGEKPKLSVGQEDFWYYYRKFFWELSRRRG